MTTNAPPEPEIAEQLPQKEPEKESQIFVGGQEGTIFTSRLQTNFSLEPAGEKSDNESDREVEEILDKRLVEGKEPWYLIKWKNIDQ